MKKEVKKEELSKKELKTISNLLFTGKWNLSLQENNQVVTPLINKIAQMIDQRNGEKNTRTEA